MADTKPSCVVCCITLTTFILLALVSYFSFEYNTRSRNLGFIYANVLTADLRSESRDFSNFAVYVKYTFRYENVSYNGNDVKTFVLYDSAREFTNSKTVEVYYNKKRPESNGFSHLLGLSGWIAGIIIFVIIGAVMCTIMLCCYCCIIQYYINKYAKNKEIKKLHDSLESQESRELQKTSTFVETINTQNTPDNPTPDSIEKAVIKAETTSEYDTTSESKTSSDDTYEYDTKSESRDSNVKTKTNPEESYEYDTVSETKTDTEGSYES